MNDILFEDNTFLIEIQALPVGFGNLSAIYFDGESIASDQTPETIIVTSV